MYVERVQDRDIEGFLRDPQEHKDVLLVEGARQVGKTCLVEHALAGEKRHCVRLNLERDRLACREIDACAEFHLFSEWLADRHGFDPAADHVLFIDEAQESRQLGGFVRFMREDWPRATVVLTGSTLSRLFRTDTRYPVGRVRRLTLWPFSFVEFLRVAGSQAMADWVTRGDLPSLSPARHGRLLERFDEFLATGGLPDVVLARQRGDDWERVRARIVADYEEDFLRVFGEDSLALVQGCMRSVANLVGGVSKNTSVVANLSTALNSRINEVYARLESWHLVLRSDQHGPEPTASQGYHPKRYLFDTGVLRSLRDVAVPSVRALDTASVDVRGLLGGVMENQVAVDLARVSGGVLAGWKRASAGCEIDFVVRPGRGQAVPVECKAALAVNRRHLRGLRTYLGLYPATVGVLVSLAPWQETTWADGKRVVNLPAYALGRLPEVIAAGPA